MSGLSLPSFPHREFGFAWFELLEPKADPTPPFRLPSSPLLSSSNHSLLPLLLIRSHRRRLPTSALLTDLSPLPPSLSSTLLLPSNYCGEFDNFAAVMSVSEDLLCAFELLKVRSNRWAEPFPSALTHTSSRLSQPLDSAQLKKEMAKNRRRLSSGVAAVTPT